MTQPLNFTAKAIEALSDIDGSNAPLTAAGIRYVVDKLKAAQVFALPDHGELLDRAKPRPELDGIVLKPPFDIVALEYTAQAPRRPTDPIYNATSCSRRISLAWDWQADLPAELAEIGDLPPGVMIASIAYYDAQQLWMPIYGTLHFPYDGEWIVPAPSPLRNVMVATGTMSKPVQKARQYEGRPFTLFPETFAGVIQVAGSLDAALDLLAADVMDEANAYFDLCFALACRNVAITRHPASDKLNRVRVKAGRLPLPDHHTLTINGEDYAGANAPTGDASDRAGPRSHLRRGHIRRLASNRVTWVNQTMVGTGRFVSKDYRMKGVAA